MVVAATAVFTGLAGQAAEDAVAARAKAGIARGAAWLLERQGTNDVWSNPTFPALTAMPAWALSVADVDRAAIVKAVEFIRGCAQPDGGIYVAVPGRRGGALGTYNTAICMTALHYADNAGSIRVIQKAREYVASTQLTGDDSAGNAGGFGYEKNAANGYADLNNSAWAIAAMRVTQDVEESRPAGEKRVDIDWKAALEFVDRMQIKPGEAGADPDDAGGFLYKRENGQPPSPPEGMAPPKGERRRGAPPPEVLEKLKKENGGKAPPWASKAPDAAQTAGKPQERPPLRSYGSITYSGLEAMIFAQVSRDDPRIVSAVDYARRHWTVDENPGMGQQGVYYYYTIMARSLSLLGVDELPAAEEGKPPVKWRDELIEKVLSLQHEDGSWSNPNNRFWESDPALATSYAMLTLEYALRLFK